MQKNYVTTAIICVAVIIAVDACTGDPGKNIENKVTVDSSQRVARGEYLVKAVGCDDCHSPKKMTAMGPEVIPELRFSGFPSSRPLPKPDSNLVKDGSFLMGADLTSTIGPWGRSFAANISSDETGIGNWTEQQFFTAIRKGKSKGLEGSRDLFPPMPWIDYKNFNDEDLKSIFAYLKSTKPVSNMVPASASWKDMQW